MKNLDNLNLTELTTEEQVNTNGGIAPLILLAAVAILLITSSKAK